MKLRKLALAARNKTNIDIPVTLTLHFGTPLRNVTSVTMAKMLYISELFNFFPQVENCMILKEVAGFFGFSAF